MKKVIIFTTLFLFCFTIIAVENEKPSNTDKVMLKIKYVSIIVEDQEKALDFYTNKLGFVKKSDIPMGKFRWLTVVSADDPDGPEVALEPNENPAVNTFQKSIFEQGIPLTAFVVDDIDQTYEQLKEKGVTFTMTPQKMGESKVAVFNDTCGNLIMITEG